MSMNVDVEMDDLSGSENGSGSEADAAEGEGEEEDVEFKSMPPAESIEVLHEKLHAKMALLRRGGGAKVRAPLWGEPSDKEMLLDERRRQRSAMREKRRKETREKIRREEEMKNKGKKKDKDKTDTRDKGNITKVRN